MRHHDIPLGGLVFAAMVAVLCGGCGTAVRKGAKGMTLAELREARTKAAHRKRRIIFNNDGNEPVYFLDEAMPEALLACRTTPLLGSQVDSIFYCTWSSGFSFFTHNTKVGQVFDTTANPKHPANKRNGFAKNKTRAFIDKGTDPLKIMVEFCHKHGIESFWSFRMNDTHDAWGSWYGEHLFPDVKKKHPEWLVSPLKKGAKPGTTSVKDYERSKHGGWSAMDFNHKEVRDLAVAFFEEVCENYDVDGIELDFFRHPVYFKNPAWGKNATKAELDKMTSMVRRVRRMTERVGLKRGRPILVGVRLPDSVDHCRAMGLDIERWMQEGLIDIMACSGYFRLNPWETSVALGHKYGVMVYPSLSETRLRDRQAARARSSLPGYRARAANALAAGVDGIYLFNSFNPRSPLWRELGDPKTLAGRDKVYTTGARGVQVINSWMANGEKRFHTRQIVSPERPMALEPGKAQKIGLRVGQQPAKGATVTLQLRVNGLPDPAALTVSLNGKRLATGAKAKTMVEYAVSPTLVTLGTNQIEVLLKPGAKTKASLVDLLLWVRYAKKN